MRSRVLTNVSCQIDGKKACKSAIGWRRSGQTSTASDPGHMYQAANTPSMSVSASATSSTVL